MTARQVRNLDHGRDDRLVALLQAAGAPLPKAAIFERVSEHFRSITDLDHSIAALLLDGRLVVAFRDGVRVYSAPASERAEEAPKSHIAEGGVTFAPTKAGPSNEDTMAKNAAAGVTRAKFIDFFKTAGKWLAVREIAAALDITPVSCKYHLTALEAQGEIKARGQTAARRYAHVSVADDAPAAPVAARTEKKRKPALRRKTARAKVQRRAATRPSRSLVPAPVTPEPVSPAPANDALICGINNAGDVGITKGDGRIALAADDIRELLRFLDSTKPLWRGRRAA